MYLGTALKIALPFAILDREDMARVYNYEGEQADEAIKACAALKNLVGMSPRRFNLEQRETARLALCWGEQYLYGYIDALSDCDQIEGALAKKLMLQIRTVRLEHFGQTDHEIASAKGSLISVGGHERYQAMKQLLINTIVVCSQCGGETNFCSNGDLCKWCESGVYKKLGS